MSCSYRINEKMYIGATIRKTGDKSTIPYHNIPFKGSKIVTYNESAFVLSHEHFPKDINLDFAQIPLLDITLLNGIIQDELIFVEMLVGAQKSGSMAQLVKTDSDEYREFMADKIAKESRGTIKMKDLKPGDVVVSALCEDGVEMIYLGMFAQFKQYHGCVSNTIYSYRDLEKGEHYGPAIFATNKAVLYPHFAIHDGKNYKIKTWPRTHKSLVDLFFDKKHVSRFEDLDKNMELISNYFNAIPYYESKRYSRKNHVFKEYQSEMPDGFKDESSRYYDDLVIISKKSKLKDTEIHEILDKILGDNKPQVLFKNIERYSYSSPYIREACNNY